VDDAALAGGVCGHVRQNGNFGLRRAEMQEGCVVPLRSIIIAVAMGIAPAVCFSQQTHELRPFTPEGGKCTFATVGGRKPVTTQYKGGEGDAQATIQLLCFDQRHCRCQVRYVDLPDPAKGLSCLQIAAGYGLASWSDPGRLKKVGTAKAGEARGEEFTATNPVTELRTDWITQVRVFVAADRAYLVSASYDKAMKADAEPEAKAFLDSFRIVAK
jgi:hypothetical protein